MSDLFWKRAGTARSAHGLLLVIALALLGLAPLPVEWEITLTIGLAWATAAVALDLWQGFLGELSFGHGVFVAIGAYTWTLLRVHDASAMVAAVAAILAAAIVAVVAGAVIVQLSHFGAAIVTFFMAFLMSAFLTSSLSRTLTGGQGGLAVPPLDIFGIDLTEGRGLYYFALILLAGAVVLTGHYARSSSGRALEMARENPLVATLLGVRLKRARLAAFVYTAGLASLAGIIIAQVLMYVTPDGFTPWQSVVLVAMVVIGGQRTILGPVIGALAYQSLATTFQSQPDLQALYTSLVFLAFVILVPGGVAHGFTKISARTRRRVARPAIASARGAERTSASHGWRTSERQPSVVGSAPALVVTDVDVEFDGVRALRGASFATNRSEIHALIGPNGAGKTTLINVVTGIQARSRGSVHLFGHDIGDLSSPRIREAGVSRTFQNPSLAETLSVIDNVRLGLYSTERRSLAIELLTGTTSAAQDAEGLQRSAEALRLVGIPEELWARPAGTISFADRKLTDLARSIVQSPKVLLLDEPTAGVSEDDIRLVEHAIRNVRDEHGTTVVVVAHHVPFVRRLADRVTVLDAGSVLATGEPVAVTSSPQVLEAFIGAAADGSQTPRVALAARAPFDCEALHDGLRVRDLSVGYGDSVVVQGLDLDVRPHEVVALTGANGAGKTTTLRALSGLTPATATTLSLGGVALATEPHAAARQGLAHVPEGRGVFASMSVLENLRIGAIAVGARADRVDDVLEQFPTLRPLLGSKAGLLSGGQQQLLAIARGLMSTPKILMIDELSLGLSPKAAQEALDAVVAIARSGPGLLLVDQNIGALAAACDRIYIVKEGRAHIADSHSELSEIEAQFF